MQNIFQIFSFSGFLRIKEFQEFLNEGRGDMNFQRFNFSTFIYNKLKEEFIDRLKMRPGGINKILLLFHSNSFSR